NSSFVAMAADDTVPVKTLLQRPSDLVGIAGNPRHPKIPLPRDLYQPDRINSRGIEFGHRAALDALVSAVAADGAPIESLAKFTTEKAHSAVNAARAGFRAWDRTPAH